MAFAAFVSFFPQLVAGPIERASALLPQVLKRRRFDFNEAASGMRLMLWGLFKKVAIADTAGLFVDEVFGPSGTTTGGAFILAALLFSVQIYGDFSGYSDMAIGIGRLFGIRLSTNFRSPFLSRSMREFWSRWHISLSQWFTTYLYLPLGGSRAGAWKTRGNVLLVFAVSGLWHGASWKFVLWGVVNGLLVLTQWRAKPPSAAGRWWPSSRELWQMGTTFVVFSATMTLFRSEDLGHLSALIRSIFEAKSGAQSAL
jgi:alginate O-acetyltransferase complex protein AlgI